LVRWCDVTDGVAIFLHLGFRTWRHSVPDVSGNDLVSLGSGKLGSAVSSRQEESGNGHHCDNGKDNCGDWNGLFHDSGTRAEIPSARVVAVGLLRERAVVRVWPERICIKANTIQGVVHRRVHIPSSLVARENEAPSARTNMKVSEEVVRSI